MAEKLKVHRGDTYNTSREALNNARSAVTEGSKYRTDA
jgi:hypothetical protein